MSPFVNNHRHMPLCINPFKVTFTFSQHVKRQCFEFFTDKNRAQKNGENVRINYNIDKRIDDLDLPDLLFTYLSIDCLSNFFRR